jgi:hypothetical protein
MTQTIQPRSWATLNKPGKVLTIQKTEEWEKENLMSSLEDDVKKLQNELIGMVKVMHSLRDAGTDYLQATQKITQRLASLIQGEEI